jgi:hypothetical protein
MLENLTSPLHALIFVEDRGADVKDICPKLGDLLEDIFFEANSLFFEIALADDIAAI